MAKLKELLTGILFLASCGFLLGAQGAVAAILRTYTSAFPASFGGRIPAFSVSTLSLMPSIPVICYITVLVSVALAGVALWRAPSRESKLYWVTALSSVNFYICAFLLSTVVVGFFLLPRAAHGI